jgi:hypothetical protein
VEKNQDFRQWPTLDEWLQTLPSQKLRRCDRWKFQIVLVRSGFFF